MAEFGVRATELSGPSMAGAQPLQPVQKDALTFDTGWIQGASKIVQGLMKPAEDQSVKDIEDKYAEGVANLTQLAEQGEISPTEFERRRVALFRNVSVTAGGKYGIAKVYQRLGKFNKDIEEASGINENQARAKFLTEAEDKMIAQGITDGLFSPADIKTPEQRAKVLSVIQDKAVKDDLIRRQKDTTELQWKKLEEERKLRKDEIEQRDQQRKEASRSFLINNTDTYNSSMMLMLKNGQERIAQGEDPKIVYQEAVAKLGAQGNQMLAGMVDSPENQALFRSMQQSLMTFSQDALDPTKLAAFDTATLNIMTTAAKSIMLSDNPDMLQVKTIVDVLGPSAASNVAVNTHAATLVTNLVQAGKGQAVSTVRAGDIAPQRTMNKVSDDLFAKAKTGTVPKEAVEQVTKYNNGVLRAIGESKSSDGANLSEALKVMGGKSMAAMIQNGTVDREAFMSARVTYEEYIQKDLYNRGKQYFNTPVQLAGRGGRPGETIPIQSQISLEADEAGNLKAVPHFRADAFKNDRGAQQSAFVSISQLNKNLGDFSEMLRIESHSMGRTDYAKVLEEYGEKMFPNMFVSKETRDKASASGYDWNGGDPSKQSSWVRRDNGK